MYVNYNQPLYRTGFRPYGHTNPWAASQLSGYSIPEAVALGQVRPFGPWTLHGMGQSHPFVETGGWGLHGLGQLVPDKAIVTYKGHWLTTALQNATDVINKVSANLRGDSLNVVNFSSDADLLTKGIGAGRDFNVTLQIQVANGMGYGQPADIGSIIDHEHYAVTGSMPLSSSTTLTAVPQADGTITLPSAAPDFSTWLEQNASWILLGALGLVIIPPLIKRVL